MLKYGWEWQYHSKSYIDVLVNQVKSISNHAVSKVRKPAFDRTDTATFTLENDPELPICKYLHLKSSDNDLAKEIDSYLKRAFDGGVGQVITLYLYMNESSHSHD